MTLEELKEAIAPVPPDCHHALMAAANSVKEDPPMKKKMAASVLLAILAAVLLAATAFAAYTLTRSPEADAVSRARRALSAEYGLTPQTLGLFYAETEQDGNTWTVTFHADGFYPPLLGDYTVALAKGGAPVTHWTHEEVDPAVWEDGSLDALVWGQPQLLKALQDSDAASAAQAKYYAAETTGTPRVTPPPSAIEEGAFTWNGQRLRISSPGPNDMPEEEALAIAKQALMEETGLTQESLDAADVMVEFYERDSGNSIWGFHLYLVVDGIEQGCGVMLDAQTGKILSTGVATGGNG